MADPTHLPGNGGVPTVGKTDGCTYVLNHHITRMDMCNPELILVKQGGDNRCNPLLFGLRNFSLSSLFRDVSVILGLNLTRITLSLSLSG